MSNYLSSEYRIQNPPQYGDLRILDNVMSTLQGRYDANKAQIDQTLALYNQNLKGIRPEDNAYIAQKLKDVKNQIDIQSKKNGNLARSYNKDSIMSTITETLQDPIVMNAITSRQNQVSFDSQIEKLKEKDGGKYVNQANIDFALHEAGKADYMAGKTNKLGAITYTPYKNLPEEHTKRLQEYVKNYDDEQYLGSEKHTNSSMHTVDIYGKRVLKEDLKKFLETSMDSGEMKQLYINAWDKFKNVKDEEVGSLIKPSFEKKLEGLKINRAEYLAQVSSGKIKENKQGLSIVDKNIADLTEKTINNKFSKNDLYSLYNEEYLDNMAGSFDKNIITKKDVDDTAFDVAKFYQSKKEFEINTALKMEDNALSREANKLKKQEIGALENQTLGTKIEDVTPSKDNPKSAFAQSIESKSIMFKEISDNLSRTDAEFAKMTSREKIAHINALDFSDKTKIKDDYPKEFVNKVKQYQQQQATHNKTYEKAIKDYEKVAISSFQDIQDEAFKNTSELKLNNIASYAPNLVRAINYAKKKGKKLDWDSMNSDTRYAIQSELINANTIKNKGGLSEDEIVINNAASLTLRRKIKDKSISLSVYNARKEFDDVNTGIIDLSLDRIGKLGSVIATVAKDAFSFAKIIPNIVNEGVNYASTEYIKDFTENKFPDFLNDKKRFTIDMLREEENLDNIEARDIGGKSNIGKRFRDVQVGLKTSFDQDYKVGTETGVSSFTYSFSTDNKAQKATADLIRQVILKSPEVESQEKEVPKKENNYSIKREGTGYKINYIEKGEDSDNVTSVFVQKLPESLMGMVDKTQDNWNNSIYNPNLKFDDNTFKSTNTYEESDKIVNNIYKYGDNVLEDNRIIDSKKGIFKPTYEYIRQDIKQEVYEKHKQKIDLFLSQPFTTKTFVNSQGVIQSDIYFKNIVDGNLDKVSTPTELKEKDDVAIQINIAQRIDYEKKKALQQLK